MTSDDYRRIIHRVVRGLADRGPCVIVGHAAQMACGDRADVLRVFVHAPLMTRTRRVAEERGISLDQAAEMVKHDDKQRNDLFSMYYGVRWNDPDLYVVTLNTGIVTMETATDVLLRLVDQFKSAR